MILNIKILKSVTEAANLSCWKQKLYIIFSVTNQDVFRFSAAFLYHFHNLFSQYLDYFAAFALTITGLWTACMR